MSIFDEIYKKNLWNSDESKSGKGSTFSITKNIRKEIPKLINNYKIKTVFDCPCGDINWIQYIFDKIPNYIGGDICKDLIEKNKTKYNKKFIVFDLRSNKIESCDLLLVRDCLFHLSYNDIFKVLENIKKSDIKYILTTNFSNRKNVDIKTGNWRPLSLQEPPFNLPKPIEIINENQYNKYKDKHLCLWKREDIPINY
jgi:hypothetical protein